MAGMNRETGKPLDGWDHVAQSIFVLFTTSFFSRLMRAYVGAHVIRLLGRLGNEQTASQARWAIATALLLFEPRFTPTRIGLTALDRTGASGFRIDGIYRPRALLGDPTPAGARTLSLDSNRLLTALPTA